MQERNINDETLSSKMLSEDTTSVITGRIPERHAIIRVNNLDYEVISNDYAKGTFKAKLVNFNKEK